MEVSTTDNSVKTIKIIAPTALEKIEAQYRKSSEILPYAKNTSFEELAMVVMPDKSGPLQQGFFTTPLILYVSQHESAVGIETLCRETRDFLLPQKGLDILSITAAPDDTVLMLVVLIRAYDEPPHFSDLYKILGEDKEKKQGEKNRLIIPRNAIKKYSDKTIQEHENRLKKQDEIYAEDIPFLNAIEKYEPRELPTIDENAVLVYDLKSLDMRTKTMLSYDKYVEIFNLSMNYIMTVERASYYAVIEGRGDTKAFDMIIDAYLYKTFIDTGRLPLEDLSALKQKLNNALFEFYILQDLIDDPEISDIKITDPFSIRVRVKGKAYISNISFINEEDYQRFVECLAIKNGISLAAPVQTFTDEHDENYILRFSITAPYITSTGFPVLHIRKINRQKMLGNDLIRAGMMTEKVRDYLCDRGKQEGGIVFAGPPGSGKTTALNWFFEEAYESSAEILIIQENDELFAYRKGVMIEHVVNNPREGEYRCTLEDLGQIALVSGANVFIIGEAKGGEICSAITLSNAGCRTAITVHSPSAEKTIDKMADLALRGYAENYNQAKRMLTSFKTIVYMENFQIKEISEVLGYDEEKRDMVYKKIYTEGK